MSNFPVINLIFGFLGLLILARHRRSIAWTYLGSLMIIELVLGIVKGLIFSHIVSSAGRLGGISESPIYHRPPV
jgi:membrane associated rhomboid family serine protease